MWERIVARRLLPSALFVVAALYLVSRGGISPSVLDFGYEANSARRVAEGQVPHRDFFALLPPIHFLLTGATVRLLGASLDSLVLFASLVGAGISVTVFGIVSRATGSVLPAAAAWTAATLFSLGMTGTVSSYTFTAVLFATLAVRAAVEALQAGGSDRWSLAAGAFVGLTAWSKQTIGAYLLMAFIAAAAVSPSVRRLTGRVMIGLLGVSFVMLSYLAVAGSLSDAFENMVTFPLSSFSAGADVPVPTLGQIGVDRAGLESMLFFAAVGALVLTIAAYGWLCAARRVLPTAAEILVTMAATGVFLVTTERYSFVKLRGALPLVIGAAAIAGANLVENLSGTARRLVVVALACPLTLLAAVGVHYTLERTEGLVEWEHAGETLRLTPDEAGRASFAVAVLEGLPPDRSVMVLPAAPLYYVLAGRQNPTEVDLVIPVLTDERRAEVVSALGEVDAVLVDESFRFDGERRLSDYEPIVDAALRAGRFELACRDASGLAFYVDASDELLQGGHCREAAGTDVGSG